MISGEAIEIRFQVCGVVGGVAILGSDEWKKD
jgi:hypothetical protein